MKTELLIIWANFKKGVDAKGVIGLCVIAFLAFSYFTSAPSKTAPTTIYRDAQTYSELRRAMDDVLREAR